MVSIFDHIYLFVARSFVPLTRELGTTDARLLQCIADIGWLLPSVPPSLGLLQSAAERMELSLGRLDQVRRRQCDGLAGAGDVSAAVTQVAIDAMRFVDALRDISSALRAELPAAFVAATGIDEEFHRRFVENSMVRRVERELLESFLLARLLGIVTVVREPGDEARFQPPFTRRRLRWDRLQALVRDPTEYARSAYGWGTSDLEITTLTGALRDLSIAMLAPGTFAPASRALERHVADIGPGSSGQPGFVIPLFSQGPLSLRIGVHPGPKRTVDEVQPLLLSVSGALGGSLAAWLSPMLHFDATTDLDLEAGLGLVLWPDRPPEAVMGTAGTVVSTAPPGRAVLAITWHGEGDGDARSSVSIGPVELSGTGVQVRAEVSTGENVEASVEVVLVDGCFVVRDAGNDGFLARVLPARGLEAAFNVAVGWSTRRGVYFRGSSTLDVVLPAHRTLGPLTLDTVAVRLIANESSVRAQASLSMGVDVGPLHISVERFGTTFDIDLGGDNLGSAGVQASFLRPEGYGLGVAAGPIVGSGRLERVDTRYAGAIALSVFGTAVSALGELDPERPGGGYSIAAVIATTFASVPIGLGFSLDAVGGLVGIHRRVDTDTLRASLRTPAGMGDIFFPADPVAQAERITTDLATYFPAAEGRHVFGPAVKFGWGTPTMVRGELAVLLELPAPARVVVLGTVSAKLPTEEQAIVDLNVDVVGEVDFARKRVAIDAALRNSTIAGFPITGDMAFRMAWGSPPSFALAIGGFHSQFPTPPGFPELRRIQIPLGAGDDPRLDAQGFLALTSNTAQIGARIDLYASAGPLNIKGGLGFETLLTFSPFQLQIDVWAGVALRRGTSTLASIHFDGHLSGPKPWRLDGKACLSLWFVDLCVPIHVSFGSGTAATLPSRQIWPALHEALATPAAWASAIPPGLAAAITAPASGAASAARLEPCATLTVSQKVVPLDRQITAFAHGRPEGVDRFRVTGVQLGAAAVPAADITSVTEWFAPAQFEEMSEADKLSRPGFEQMVGGVSIGAATIRAGAPLVRALDYDTVVVVNGERQVASAYRPTRDQQIEGTLAATSARPPLRATGAAAFLPPAGQPPRLRLVEETFVIASTDELAPRWDLAAAGTRGQVELALRAHLAANPGDAGRLQVVPSFEVAA